MSRPPAELFSGEQGQKLLELLGDMAVILSVNLDPPPPTPTKALGLDMNTTRSLTLPHPSDDLYERVSDAALLNMLVLLHRGILPTATEEDKTIARTVAPLRMREIRRRKHDNMLRGLIGAPLLAVPMADLDVPAFLPRLDSFAAITALSDLHLAAWLRFYLRNHAHAGNIPTRALREQALGMCVGLAFSPEEFGLRMQR